MLQRLPARHPSSRRPSPTSTIWMRPAGAHAFCDDPPRDAHRRVMMNSDSSHSPGAARRRSSCRLPLHPGVELGANLKSVSHR